MTRSRKTSKKTKKLIPLQIDRERWGTEALLNNNGTMCCLGFACKKLGVSAKEMLNQSMPAALEGRGRSKVRMLLRNGVDKATASKAAEINDEPSYTRSEKETKLKPVLAKLGFAVKFIERIK
jgi:hypothetical protein